MIIPLVIGAAVGVTIGWRAARSRARAEMRREMTRARVDMCREVNHWQEAAARATAEAARVAGMSASYLRRLIRRGDTELSRGQQSAPYLVSTDDLAACLRGRREENKRRTTRGGADQPQ